MRLTNVAAALSTAIAVMSISAVVLIGASPAHADISGYGNCLSSVKEVPLNEHDSLSLQLARLVEMDLNSGVSPADEAQKVGPMGFDPQLANAVVRCAAQEKP
jgi:hypothetical protein